MTKVRMTVSEQEHDLVGKSRELKKLEAKRGDAVKAEEARRAEAAKKLEAIDAEITRVRGEISTLIQPVIPAPPPA